MSAKLSKELIDCVHAGRFLLSAFEVEGPRVAGLFLEETRPHLEDGDVEPRPDGFLVAVMRRLRAAVDHLEASDLAVANAMGWESELRGRHQAAKRELAFMIVALRRLVLSQYEEPDMDNLALQPVNVRDARTVLRRAELVGERFEAENLAKMLGRPRFDQPIDLEPYVAQIRRQAAELAALAREVDEAHRATDRARRTRTKAKVDFDRIYLRGARMFEDMCRFAGLDELASKIRGRQRLPAAVEDTAAVKAEPALQEHPPAAGRQAEPALQEPPAAGRQAEPALQEPPAAGRQAEPALQEPQASPQRRQEAPAPQSDLYGLSGCQRSIGQFDSRQVAPLRGIGTQP